MTYQPAAQGRPFSVWAAIASLTVFAVAATARPDEPSVQWDETAARHLLSRTSFGDTPEQARRFAAMTLHQAVDALLDDAARAEPPPQPEWIRDVWINGWRRYADMSREEYLILFRRNYARNIDELNDLKAWWLRHMALTKAPLREQMTLFWSGHFTSSSAKVNTLSQAHYQQNQTWRKHALGNFREFLEAVTLDPAMLIYLDMEESTKENPNENYARELLELFCLGVGNYTEKDIREAARALTGWTLDAPPGTVLPMRPNRPGDVRSFLREGLVPKFVVARHDEGETTLFGKTRKRGVKETLDDVAHHPACASHVAGRLIHFFGAQDAEGTLKRRMAKAFAARNFEIRPMLKELFTSPEFYAESSRGNQVKSPIRLLVGACRDLAIEGEVTPTLAQTTAALGQELFNPPTVKGWPSGVAWINASSLALRYRLAETLLDAKELTTEPLGRERLTLVPRLPEEAAKTIRRLLELDAEFQTMQRRDGIRVRVDAKKL
ncbi:MAG: DUF1800 domain-containing protein, partial [Gemmataceae bacterium]